MSTMTDGKALHDLARAIAVVAHAGQSRKGTGEAYFNHVERVALAQQGWYRRTVAYLHDTIEDTDIEVETLITLGFPEDIVQDVLALTRHAYGKETYNEFIERTSRGGKDVISIKLADVRDNLSDIGILPGDGPSLRKKYIKAEARLLEAEENLSK